MDLFETIAIVAKDFIVNIGKDPEYGSNKVLSKNLQIAATTFFENSGEQKRVETDKINFELSRWLIKAFFR